MKSAEYEEFDNRSSPSVLIQRDSEFQGRAITVSALSPHFEMALWLHQKLFVG